MSVERNAARRSPPNSLARTDPAQLDHLLERPSPRRRAHLRPADLGLGPFSGPRFRRQFEGAARSPGGARHPHLPGRGQDAPPPSAQTPGIAEAWPTTVRRPGSFSMRRVNNTTSKRSRPLWTTCQGPLMLIAEFRALCCLATATASPPRRAVQASRRTPQQMAGRRWSPPRRVERTGHLSAPPGPLAPQRDIDRPLRVNRVTVTVSDLGRQPLGQRSPAATPLPPEVTMPSPIGLVHPVAQIRDLARDLGVSCTQILQIASALGLRASCPSSVVTVQQAEQIQSAYLRTDSLSRVPAPR